MKILKSILDYIHLDPVYNLLTIRSAQVVHTIFKALDIHEEGLNDIQFYSFMKFVTNLNDEEIQTVFEKLDIDRSGTLEFEEFYFIVCVLIAVKDKREKEFIYRHSRTVFDLLDEDASDTVSADEFNNIGFLFNFRRMAVNAIFNDFDISGDQELDYKEFKMFTMACIDRQHEINTKKQKDSLNKSDFHKRREKQKKLDFAVKNLRQEFWI